MKFANLLAFVLVLSGQSVAAQSALDYTSEDGLCDGAEIESLISLKQSGSTVAVTAAQIYPISTFGSRPTGVSIPAMTPLSCYAAADGRVLVAAEAADRDYCGWIEKTDTLREGQAGKARADGTVLQDQNATSACPALLPFTVTQFCARMDALEEPEILCEDIRNDDGGLRENPIATKFLTWNANVGGSDGRSEVPLYLAPNADSRSDESLNIFTVLKVWDVQANDDGVFFLVGPGQKSVLGWVRSDSGTVWFSKLTTFFAQNGKRNILISPPGTRSNDTLATRPGNLAQMLNGKSDFPKFPVLVDRRDINVAQDLNQKPHLKVAFIGAYCEDGQLCVSSNDDAADALQNISNIDTLFLIDATKSMRNYYALVAKAVEEITTERASTNTHFGVSMYGDYLSKNAQNLTSAIQFRNAIELTTIVEGDEFEELGKEKLYIKDPSGGRAEAAFSALYQAVKSTDWSEKGARFIIHLADHGDRASAPDALIALLREQNIFYVPIAVRGEYVKNHNDAFFKQTAEVVSKLAIGDGAVMGIATQKTYRDGGSGGDQAAYRAILKSLRASTDLQKVLSADVVNDILGNNRAQSAADSSRYPNGYAELTKAARKIFGIDSASIESKVDSRTVAAEGFVEITNTKAETDWTYQIALEPRDLGILIRDFELLCKSMKDGNAAGDVSKALKSVIEVLTGDTLTSNKKFYAYFNNRDKIPLVTQTILGEGIMDLGRDLDSFQQSARDRVDAYQKEACRTSRLLRLMDSERKVENPFEKRAADGLGDLIWNAESRNYQTPKVRKFKWKHLDLFETVRVYLPLSYLPRPYSK